jgi:hypothetical protein
MAATGQDWVQDVWHGAKIKSLREAHARGHYEVTDRCAGCDTWGTQEEFENYVEFSDSSYFMVF